MAFHANRISLPQAADSGSREVLFRESLAETAERWALGTAWALMPQRIAGVPSLARMWFSEALCPNYALPDPERTLDNPLGLAGIAHELSLPTLLSAHRRGLFPFAHIGPQKWWSPPVRSVLFFNELHVAKRLRRQMRQGQYTVTFDRDFDAVIKACAGNRSGRWHVTWITPKIMHAYAAAFDAGHAHSFEVWNEKGELAGGGYGVAVGNSFVTESQFSREPNTSKIGFTVLNWHLANWGFAFNDGKDLTPTTRDMGFREIPRRDFLNRLTTAVKTPGRIGRWQVEADMAKVADWQPQENKPAA
ncbi:MAG: leucyl/phenylalanyl-tRNA--protein transferase [Pseudolabrys sp.]|nr:leucyl/phenylalanyl-tRNA--protein transferase [Pseudolabrys sp.]